METTSNDPAPKFHVPVHSIIHSMQKQHGIIPHQDYTQYRRYCTRRLDRLRHVKSGGREMLHGSGGRGKHASNFIPRKYLNKKGFEEKTNSTKTDSTKTAVNTEEVVVAEESSEAATDYYDKVHHVNFLLILLVSAERCWSFAMELKAEYDEMKHANATKKQTPTLYKKKKHTSLGKLRKQFLRKLRKAAEYAASLENMAMNVLTTEVTVVECQAYASWMRGNAALERNRFEPAEREYSNALQGIQVLKQLAANGSNLEMQDYFSSRAEYTIEPLRAYCYYELQQQQSSKGDNSSYSAAVVPNTISNANLGMSQLLQSKLEQKMEETRRAETSKTDSKYGSIVYRGITVSVDSEDLRMALCKIDELQQLSSSSTIPVGETETNNTEGDENFVKLLNAYDEASNICSFQLKELGKLASGKYVNASKRMYNCVKGFMQHQKLVATMERNEQIANNLSLPRTQEAEDQKIKRMEDLAHMYSLLLQDARMLTSLPSATDDGTNSSEVLVEEDDFALEAHAHVLRFRSFKCFYAAHLYSSKELYHEALVLLNQAALLASQAIEELVACELAESLITRLKDLEDMIEKVKCHTKASAYIAKLGGKKKKDNNQALLDRLDDYDAGDATLFDVHPAMDFIPCKPSFFDIALNYVGDLPDLNAILDAHENSQSLKSGGFFGWLRRAN